MKYRFVLHRWWQDFNQTFGTLVVFNDKGLPVFSCSTVERGGRNNEPNVSCVNEGIYKLVWERSSAFKMMLWELYGTEGRSECKIHPANSWHQLEGCIAPGTSLKDIDGDGYVDVRNSKETLGLLHEVTKGQKEAVIEIIDWF